MIQRKELSTLPLLKKLLAMQLVNPNIYIIIKSTIPLGFTESMKAKFKLISYAFPQNFLEKVVRFMTTYIHPELL